LVVDFHTHVGHRRFWNPAIVEEFTRLSPSFVESMDTLMTPEKLIEFFKGQGIDYAVCIADNSPITGYVPNDFVLDFCKGHPELIPFCSVNPHDPDITEVMVPYVQRHRIGGFKFFPTYQYFYPNDRQLYSFYEFLQSAGKVVMFHTGTSNFPGAKTLYGDPIYIEEIAVDFPQLKVVMAHSGRPFWYDKAFYLSRLHENLYMDLAGVPPQHLMTYFPKLESNADRILFGTDFPAQPKPLHTLIETIERLPLRPESIEKILGENARRVLGL
jgi:predicted TIM-barrel fold metal-dependent hydrolase